MNVIGLSITTLTAILTVALADTSAKSRQTETAFTIDQIFGSRPIVQATINGKPYRLVIHANAGSYLQLNHAEAATVQARDLKHRGAYGISEPGKVSDLGRDDGYVDNLAIGSWRVPFAPVAVFEVQSGSAQGMLGLPFLHESNAILDFGARKLLLPGSVRSSTLEMDMAKRGYTKCPMTRDPNDGRYLVNVTVNGKTAPMVVSTVAAVDLDTNFATRASIKFGAVSGSYGGPSGAIGDVYDIAKPIKLKIGTWSTTLPKASIQDTYAYSKNPRPADLNLARGGALGADFMIEHSAIIDFGNSVLYLKNNSKNR